MAHDVPAWCCAHAYKPGLIKISDTNQEITHLVSPWAAVSAEHPEPWPPSYNLHIYPKAFSLHRERDTLGAWAWGNASEIIVRKGRLYPELRWVWTHFPGVPGGACAAIWVCGAILSRWSAKGEWGKVNQVAWGRRSEKLSIALGLSQRGGEEAYVELVLLVSGKEGCLQFSDQHNVGRQVWFIWAAECPGVSPTSQTSCIPPFSASASPVPRQVLVRAALLLFHSLSQEHPSELWSFFLLNFSQGDQ